jgi:hypothetical protein
MSLKDQITQDMKAAMKAKDSATLSTLRLLQSAMKNKQIEKGEELSDEDVQNIIKKEVKKLKDSRTSFADAGRAEKVEDIDAEISVLEEYLPEQMGDDELERLVKDVVEGVGAESMADMGEVMGAAMERVEGRADGNRVRQFVESVLKVVLVAIAASFFIAEPVHAAAPLFPGTSNRELFEFLLRMARVIFVVAGIVGVNLILKGGFTIMVSGSRYEAKQSAIKSVTSGVFTTGVIALLFIWATVALQQLA